MPSLSSLLALVFAGMVSANAIFAAPVMRISPFSTTPLFNAPEVSCIVMPFSSSLLWVPSVPALKLRVVLPTPAVIVVSLPTIT